jgi:hypothetical protein
MRKIKKTKAPIKINMGLSVPKFKALSDAERIEYFKTASIEDKKATIETLLRQIPKLALSYPNYIDFNNAINLDNINSPGIIDELVDKKLIDQDAINYKILQTGSLSIVKT